MLTDFARILIPFYGRGGRGAVASCAIVGEHGANLLEDWHSRSACLLLCSQRLLLYLPWLLDFDERRRRGGSGCAVASDVVVVHVAVGRQATNGAGGRGVEVSFVHSKIVTAVGGRGSRFVFGGGG